MENISCKVSRPALCYFWLGRKRLATMDQFYDILKLYADHFAKTPMFPVLKFVHLTIMNLKLRMEGGK